VDDRGEWQQRMHAVLYHHGLPRRQDLLTAENRAWLQRASPPAAAREQITVALKMIDALDVQLASVSKELCASARRQPGCKALIAAHYGIGALTSVTILAELGDCTRFSSSRYAVRYGGMDITVYASDRRRAPGHLSRQGPPALRWALYEAAQAAIRPGSPDRDYYLQAAARLGHNRACPGDRAQAAQTLLPHAQRTRRGGTRARMSFLVRAMPPPQPMHRGPLPAFRCRHVRVDGLQRPSGRLALPPSGNPITIISPARSQPEVADRDKHGRPRAHQRR
jgi:transposase